MVLQPSMLVLLSVKLLEVITIIWAPGPINILQFTKVIPLSIYKMPSIYNVLNAADFVSPNLEAIYSGLAVVLCSC